MKFGISEHINASIILTTGTNASNFSNWTVELYEQEYDALVPKSSDVLSNSLQSRVVINEGVDSLHLFNYLADVTLPVNTWRH